MSVHATRTITPIDGTNGKFEYYQYNEDLRIIHSVEDDMFHAGSIVSALGSTKRVNNWLRNEQTIELLSGYKSLREFAQGLLMTKHKQFNNVKCIEGTYIHRLLVNHFAMWVSPKYAYKISLVLDDHFELRRQVEENRALDDKNKTLMQKVDELLARNDELLSINRDQTNRLKRMEEKQDKTNARLKALDRLPKRTHNNVSSGNTPEIVYIYSIPNECDNNELIIHLAARTEESLKKIRSNVHTVYAYYKVGNAKDHVREIFNEAMEACIVTACHKSYEITIDSANLPEFKGIIAKVCRKLNAPSEIIKQVITKINLDDTIEKMKTEWEITDENIKNICKRHAITVEQLCEICNGTVRHVRNGKQYDIAISEDGNELLYARQIGNSPKYYRITTNRFIYGVQ